MIRHTLDPAQTTWHITWGTYGARLHGGDAATVDREHNQRGQRFLGEDPAHRAFEQSLMRGNPVVLTSEQQQLIQSIIPDLCVRGGWTYRVCSAGGDHVHVLLDVDSAVHGELVRRLLKRWITQALNQRWPRPRSETWWADQGSNKPVKDDAYLNNAFPYIEGQRIAMK